MSEETKSIRTMFDYIQFDRVMSERLRTFPDLVGHNEILRLDDTDLSISTFLTFFEDILPNAIVHSSLTEFVAHLEYASETELSLLEVLKRRGWLESGKTAQETDSVFKTTYLDSQTKDDIEALATCVFSGLTYGYVFIDWPEEQLVVYPHKRAGFGLIAKKGTVGHQLAKKFLDTLDNHRFKVVYS